MLCRIRQDKELKQLLDEDPSQTLSELGNILQVDESTVSKRLKGLGMIQKQGHWVPYELITGDRYRLQLMRLSRALKEKRPLYAQRHDKVILLHDNARPHVAKPVKIYLETLKWEVLPHPLYSSDIAPSDFHLFLTVSAVASVRARRSRVRRTCDNVRGHSTTPWPPWVPEAVPADAGPAAAAMEEGVVAAAIADEDDLHHHGN
ncbi:MOS1T transposase, partial [Pseudoatta argentina]